MARAALGRAFLVAGGTIVGLGAATAVVTTASMVVAKAVMDKGRVSDSDLRNAWYNGLGTRACCFCTDTADARIRPGNRGTTQPVCVHVPVRAHACTVCMRVCRVRVRAQEPCVVDHARVGCHPEHLMCLHPILTHMISCHVALPCRSSSRHHVQRVMRSGRWLVRCAKVRPGRGGMACKSCRAVSCGI